MPYLRATAQVGERVRDDHARRVELMKVDELVGADGEVKTDANDDELAEAIAEYHEEKQREYSVKKRVERQVQMYYRRQEDQREEQELLLRRQERDAKALNSVRSAIELMPHFVKILKDLRAYVSLPQRIWV